MELLDGLVSPKLNIELVDDLGDFAILAARTRSTGRQQPCFVPGEPHRLSERELLLSFLFETPTDLVGVVPPSLCNRKS